ncbi:MAG: sensor histidine kinase [Proteobacteria bacterium]|nr:sensor histidine kinase [Pseudomonadota bacterium]
MKFSPKIFGLRSAVILLVLVPLLATFGLGSYLLLATLETRLEERLQEDIALIARTLKVPLARAVERDRERSLDRALRSTFEFGRVYGVYVYDDDGEMIARADDLSDTDPVTLGNLDVESEETTSEYRSMGGREVFSYFTPLTGAGGQVIGMLQVTRRASEIRDYIDAARFNALLIMLGFGIAFIGIIALGYHVAIGKPLRRLADAMGAVAAGDTSIRTSDSGPHEIRWLIQRFNNMLEGIVRRDAALARERRGQIRLQAQLRASEKYALVGRLAAGVAHELGTPLSVVDGYAQRLLRNASPDQKEHATLLRIREAAARMSSIVQQLLGFGREASRNYAPVFASRLVALAVSDSRNAFEQFDSSLDVRRNEHDALLYVDESRMREALTHLLRNAANAARDRSVRIGWSVQASTARITVEDAGPGIETKDRERVFDPFFTTKPPGEGSGLGLAIVHGIVADHGAQINVDVSELGGAAFHIDFERVLEE